MSSANPRNTSVTSRRTFLRAALAAGIGAAAVVVAHHGVTAVANAAEEANQPAASQGYHLTPHINAYYQSAAY